MNHKDPDGFQSLTEIPESTMKIPAYLYKYRSLNNDEWERDLIVNQILYFPDSKSLNDPFDCNPAIDTSSTREDMNKFIRGFVNRTLKTESREKRRRHAREIQRDKQKFVEVMTLAHRQTMEQLGVFSLTSECLDLLMWAHYADKHQGICIRFNTLQLLYEGHAPIPVEYAHERPLTNPASEEPEKSTIATVQTKGKAWAYEKEWRLILNQGGNTSVRLERAVIDGVIVGARINDSDLGKIRQWIMRADRRIDLFRACFHKRRYGLVLESI